MRPFTYLRPTSLPETLELLQQHAGAAVLLAGGTDLVIGLRGGAVRPAVVVDLKRVAGLRPGIEVVDGHLRISATTTMSELVAHETVRADFPALAEAAAVVGSVQIRNRATLAGNLCNASPAADTAPALLVYDATLRLLGPQGERRLALDDFFVRSGVTALQTGELVTAVDLPLPEGRRGSVHLRHTRRRGHDLAAVALAVAIDDRGTTRLAFGSVGPRPYLGIDVGTLADPRVPAEAQEAALARLLAPARPSPTSMRAGPVYRAAMLRTLAERGMRIARQRRDAGRSA